MVNDFQNPMKNLCWENAFLQLLNFVYYLCSFASFHRILKISYLIFVICQR